MLYNLSLEYPLQVHVLKAWSPGRELLRGSGVFKGGAYWKVCRLLGLYPQRGLWNMLVSSVSFVPGHEVNGFLLSHDVFGPHNRTKTNEAN